jgi:ubiquinone/menaquinone biosynthesis C-methylase UbiE
MSQTPESNDRLKEEVAEFWSRASCGEDLYLKGDTAQDYRHQMAERYRLEPYIPKFADAATWRGQEVLEVGVGLGSDHQLFAEAGAILSGIDYTERAIEHTKRRLELFGLQSDLQRADAEDLPFPDARFDLVYSWGVIHHAPNTSKAAQEILRVLKPGAAFKVMIYHKWSLVGLMLWLRYGLGSGRPFISLDRLYSEYLESPGTKAYTLRQAARLFEGAVDLKQSVVVTHGDLLEGAAGQRHTGRTITMARTLWPRWFFRRFAQRYGLFLLIEGRKPSDPTRR